MPQITWNELSDIRHILEEERLTAVYSIKRLEVLNQKLVFCVNKIDELILAHEDSPNDLKTERREG